MPKIDIHVNDETTQKRVRDWLNSTARQLDYRAVYELLDALATGQLKIVPAEITAAAVVGYIKINRRVATPEHECSECGNEIGNLDLYLTVYADGGTGAVVCGDCATN